MIRIQFSQQSFEMGLMAKTFPEEDDEDVLLVPPAVVTTIRYYVYIVICGSRRG